jgi:hypothetical protein
MKRFMQVITAGALAAVVAFAAQNGSSAASAKALQAKIDAIKAAQTNRDRSRQTVEISEVELESYVLYQLRDDIPAKLESVDVQLTDGAVAADTKLTFAPDTRGTR